MRDFTMSMYRSKEDLYKDKAMYWEKMFDALLFAANEGELMEDVWREECINELESVIKEKGM